MTVREQIEPALCTMRANTVIEARCLYERFAEDVSEAAFYKTLERLCQKGVLAHLAKGLYYRPKTSRFGTVPMREQDIVAHYVDNQRPLVVGYRLFNRKGLTTQISKTVDVLSNALPDQKKTVRNVHVKNISCVLNDDRVATIEALEILQNFGNIEDLNTKAFLSYVEHFAQTYSDADAMYVIEHMNYKKSTIAFLAALLTRLNVRHSLQQFLSALSTYKFPNLEDLYETA